jgi:hypothetical protein
MKKRITIRKAEKAKFEQEHERIMNLFGGGTVVQQQWTHFGDMFQQLSLYEDHQPVRTSNSTSTLR